MCAVRNESPADAWQYRTVQAKAELRRRSGVVEGSEALRRSHAWRDMNIIFPNCRRTNTFCDSPGQSAAAKERNTRKTFIERSVRTRFSATSKYHFCCEWQRRSDDDNRNWRRSTAQLCRAAGADSRELISSLVFGLHSAPSTIVWLQLPYYVSFSSAKAPPGYAHMCTHLELSVRQQLCGPAGIDQPQQPKNSSYL